MFALTGLPLLVLAFLAAAGSFVAIIVWWSRSTRRSSEKPTKSWRWVAQLAGKVGLLLLCQALILGVVSLEINRQGSFYSSWKDLFGKSYQEAEIKSNEKLNPGKGRLTTETINNIPVRVWLPEQYDQPEFHNTKFPVVTFLPGFPSNRGGVFHQYDFGRIASRAIDEGKVAPFVAIFPPITIAPPRNTECTDIAGGPQAEKWLYADIPSAVTAHLRVVSPGPQWSIMGWSMGGFCAAKEVLKHPEVYGSAVSFGGYYEPIENKSTQGLFFGDKDAKNNNSPLWWYNNHGLRGKLLIIAGKKDKSISKESRKMIEATVGNPDVFLIEFEDGAHNYIVYRAYLGQSLEWLHAVGALKAVS